MLRYVNSVHLRCFIEQRAPSTKEMNAIDCEFKSFPFPDLNLKKAFLLK